MRALLGYCAHLASVRLHEVAVGLMCCESEVSPAVWFQHRCLYCGGDGAVPIGIEADRDWCPDCGGSGENMCNAELSDVSPRLAAAIDWGRDRWRHVAWLAGGGGMGK